MKPNPNGANGSTSDPREQLCWDYFVTTITSKGKGNAKQSAIKAGYSEEHADNITLQGWFKERLKKLRKGERLSRAEKNLEEVQCLDIYNDEGKIEKDVLRVRTDVDKFIAKTHDKETYSDRTELTGKDGDNIIVGIQYVTPDNTETNNKTTPSVGSTKE